VNGVSEDFFYVKGMNFASGQPFDKESVTEQAQDVVIDSNTKNTFFADGTNPVGQVILLGSVPSRIIGVIEEQKSMMGNSDSLNVYLPYSTVMSRMLGQSNVRSIIVRVKDEYPSAAAENAILNLLVQRHGAQDVFTQNSDSIRETIQQTTANDDLIGVCNCGDFIDRRWYWGHEHYVGFCDGAYSRNWCTYGCGCPSK
jgi:hypothetical protein